MRYLIVALALVAGCSSDPSPGPPAPEPARSQPAPCGAVDIVCNCTYTSAYPGATVPTSLCESGYHRFGTCGYCPGGGYAWYTTCVCQ